MKAAEQQATWAKFTFLLGWAGTAALVVTLAYTAKAANAAQISARAAERAVEESVNALAHAQQVADRQLRPWLTIEATLDSAIRMAYKPEDTECEPEVVELLGIPDVEFFVKLNCTNVGNTGAANIVYIVTGADFSELIDPGAWFRACIEKAVSASVSGLPNEWRERRSVGDSLAPSERYTSRHWCPVHCPVPPKRPHWNGYQFCVCVVVAYTGTGVTAATKDNAFYTAKIFPIGFPQVPTFQRFIGPNRLPIGPGDIAIGPVQLADAT